MASRTAQESARIRVESVIRENLMMQAFEILELYTELLSVRMQLIAKVCMPCSAACVHTRIKYTFLRFGVHLYLYTVSVCHNGISLHATMGGIPALQ